MEGRSSGFRSSRASTSLQNSSENREGKGAGEARRILRTTAETECP